MSLEKKLKQVQKQWKQGKYKTAVRTTGFCVATACVVLLGVYFFRGRQAESDLDALRQAKQNAIESGEKGEPLQITNKEVMSQYRDLFLQNPDMIGWLTIEGTNVDSVVMWVPEQNDFYLNRGFDKQESQNGLFFLDEASNINEDGGNLIVYGHNMKNGSMFADLLKYEKESFWKEHSTILFDTLYESRVYEIGAVAKSTDLSLFPYDFTSASEETARAAISRMQEASLYDTGVDMRYGDEFLTLSTCDYSEPDGRFVVMARRIQ
ncbi:MAG: class B sortase [Lachnospiraceae bacterium]|nr:class B sortase [Lachnospiraceae bacterium]